MRRLRLLLLALLAGVCAGGIALPPGIDSSSFQRTVSYAFAFNVSSLSCVSWANDAISRMTMRTLGIALTCDETHPYIMSKGGCNYVNRITTTYAVTTNVSDDSGVRYIDGLAAAMDAAITSSIRFLPRPANIAGKGGPYSIWNPPNTVSPVLNLSVEFALWGIADKAQLSAPMAHTSVVNGVQYTISAAPPAVTVSSTGITRFYPVDTPDGVVFPPFSRPEFMSPYAVVYAGNETSSSGSLLYITAAYQSNSFLVVPMSGTVNGAPCSVNQVPLDIGYVSTFSEFVIDIVATDAAYASGARSLITNTGTTWTESYFYGAWQADLDVMKPKNASVALPAYFFNSTQAYDASVRVLQGTLRAVPQSQLPPGINLTSVVAGYIVQTPNCTAAIADAEKQRITALTSGGAKAVWTGEVACWSPLPPSPSKTEAEKTLGQRLKDNVMYVGIGAAVVILALSALIYAFMRKSPRRASKRRGGSQEVREDEDEGETGSSKKASKKKAPKKEKDDEEDAGEGEEATVVGFRSWDLKM